MEPTINQPVFKFGAKVIAVAREDVFTVRNIELCDGTYTYFNMDTLREGCYDGYKENELAYYEEETNGPII
jgi:hypothetical protein